jgi:hypothetical protein
MKKQAFFLFTLLTLAFTLPAQELVSSTQKTGAFPLVSSGKAAAIVFDAGEDSLVHKTVQLFAQDIERVTGQKPSPASSLPSGGNVVIIGTLQSNLIKQLISLKKIDAKKLQGKWEAFQVQVVKNPFKGISQALVIAGSDRRGTAYGALEISRQMGVSPWYWWADVPVRQKKEVWVTAATPYSDAPKVKYRGIFINDEAPALSGWSRMTFGGFNHYFYEKVFELMLRMKSNYIWPAMWGSAFYDDDPLNKQTADTYGIVIGTSHHEPLMRAHDEWRRYGQGKWNYDSNEVRLKKFWEEGIRRSLNTETLVSVGMRGDGDEPMTEGTAIALLERIVKDQREIISRVTGRDASAQPQLWALYKEVQDYYDKGMQVPDDVTLLLCDDNWGNIRRLPKPGSKPRKGGYGIYYHFDYVGGPRNYKWINTNNIARVWEQMHLAWEHNARQIWIVNVGDIKPMELPTSFFLDYAWNPARWNENNLNEYYMNWSREQFGGWQVKAIAGILKGYSQLAARRKPELLSADTYHLFNYDEWTRVLGEHHRLLEQAEEVNEQLPASHRDAFYQLVLHPVKALANLHELYYNVAWNQSFASYLAPETNEYAEKAKQDFLEDSLITLEYHGIAGGKWNHMMDQTHIGYTYWQQPEVNKMPTVTYLDSVVQASEVEVQMMGPTSEDIIPRTATGNIFYTSEGAVSMEAENWTRAVNTKGIKWKVIPNIGRTSSGITTFPVTAPASLSAASPRVEYDFYTYGGDSVRVHLYCSPTLDFYNEGGLKMAVSIDNEAPVIVNLNANGNVVRTWEPWVAANLIIKTTKHKPLKKGKHVLKYWMISPGVVLQKIVVDLGGLESSYLGPPETRVGN